VGGKVYDRFDAVDQQHVIDLIGILQVAYYEVLRRDGGTVTRGKVVEHPDFVIVFEKSANRVTANVSGAARD
jgi:hypothetical protein